MTQKTKHTQQLEFRVHMPNLLNEILDNQTTGILTKPLQVTGRLLFQVAERARAINDGELNRLMLMLALYSASDPNSHDYDKDIFDKPLGEDVVKLVDDARTVAHETGKTPRQLADELAEAETKLVLLRQSEDGYSDQVNTLSSLLEKSQAKNKELTEHINTLTEQRNAARDQVSSLRADKHELLAALKAAERGFLSDAKQKSIIGDDVIYHLDGQSVGHALNIVRAAIAKAEGGAK